MKGFLRLIFCFLLVVSFISCSSSDEASDNDTDPVVMDPTDDSGTTDDDSSSDDDGTIEPDPAGKISRVYSLENGYDMSYAYDSDGRLIKQEGQNEEGLVYTRTYTYNSLGQLVSELSEYADPPYDPFEISFSYDEQGRLIRYGDVLDITYLSETEANMIVDSELLYNLTLDSEGRLISIDSEFSDLNTWSFNSSGNLTRYVDNADTSSPLGANITYDNKHNPFNGQFVELQLLRTLSLTTSGGIFRENLRRFNYPYLSNNILMLRQDGASDFNTLFYSYEYQGNFPVKQTLTLGPDETVYIYEYSE